MILSQTGGWRQEAEGVGERGRWGEGEMDIGENKLSHDKGHQRVGQKKKKKKCLLF